MSKYYMVKIIEKDNKEPLYLRNPLTKSTTFYTEQEAIESWGEQQVNYDLNIIKSVNVIETEVTEHERTIKKLPVTLADKIFNEIDQVVSTYSIINPGYITIINLIDNYKIPYERYSPEDVDIIESILSDTADICIIMDEEKSRFKNTRVVSILTDFYDNKITLRGTYIPSLKGLYFKDLPGSIKSLFRGCKLQVKLYRNKAFDNNFLHSV